MVEDQRAAVERGRLATFAVAEAVGDGELGASPALTTRVPLPMERVVYQPPPVATSLPPLTVVVPL